MHSIPRLAGSFSLMCSRWAVDHESERMAYSLTMILATNDPNSNLSEHHPSVSNPSNRTDLMGPAFSPLVLLY